jgi:hypothetical protein
MHLNQKGIFCKSWEEKFRRIPEYQDYAQDVILFQYPVILPDNGTLFECLKLVVIMWRMTLGKIGIIQQRHEINLLLLSKKNN